MNADGASRVTSPADEVIRLEPLGSGHLEGLAELGRDPDVQRFTYVPSPWPEGFERGWLGRYEQGAADGTRAGFAIIDRADSSFLGLAALVQIDRAGSEAEAGYIVSPRARGRGIAARALRLLTDWAFHELALERVELRISADNCHHPAPTLTELPARSYRSCPRPSPRPTSILVQAPGSLGGTPPACCPLPA